MQRMRNLSGTAPITTNCTGIHSFQHAARTVAQSLRGWCGRLCQRVWAESGAQRIWHGGEGTRRRLRSISTPLRTPSPLSTGCDRQKAPMTSGGPATSVLTVSGERRQGRCRC